MEPWEYPSLSGPSRSWVAGVVIVLTVLVGYGTWVWLLSEGRYDWTAFWAVVLWVIFDVELTVLPPWVTEDQDDDE